MKFAGMHLLVDLVGRHQSVRSGSYRPGAARSRGSRRRDDSARTFPPLLAERRVSAACWCWRRAISPSTHGPSGISPRSTSSCAARAIRITAFPRLKAAFQPDLGQSRRAAARPDHLIFAVTMTPGDGPDHRLGAAPFAPELERLRCQPIAGSTKRCIRTGDSASG